MGALNGLKRSVGWISLQPDDSISVGLSDRTFIAPDFRARNFLWNANNRVTLKYTVPDSPETLKPITNPHLTFHPPLYFHLRENKKDELWAGIADVAIMIEQEGRVPWIRFISKPFAELKVTGSPRNPSKSEIRKIEVNSDNCSIGLEIDFIRCEGREPQKWVRGSYADATERVDIDIRLHTVPAQISTLSWLHHY